MTNLSKIYLCVPPPSVKSSHKPSLSKLGQVKSQVIFVKVKSSQVACHFCPSQVKSSRKSFLSKSSQVASHFCPSQVKSQVNKIGHSCQTRVQATESSQQHLGNNSARTQSSPHGNDWVGLGWLLALLTDRAGGKVH